MADWSMGSLGLAIARAGHRAMPPKVEFLPAVQRGQDTAPNVSWWQIPIRVLPSRYLRRQMIERAEIWAIPYLGDQQAGSGITLRWATRDGPQSQITLELGRPRLVPFVRRDEGSGEGDGVAFITSDNWHTSGERKWELPTVAANRWKFEVRGAEGALFRSERFYWVNQPPREASNGHFFVEVLTGV